MKSKEGVIPWPMILKKSEMFYMRKTSRKIVTVPPMNFLAVSGQVIPTRRRTSTVRQRCRARLYAQMSYKGLTSPDFTNMSCRRWKASGGSRALPVWIIRRRWFSLDQRGSGFLISLSRKISTGPCRRRSGRNRSTVPSAAFLMIERDCASR